MGGTVTALLVDGDPIVYRCGFAAQRTVVHDIVEDEHGGIHPMRFEGRAARRKYYQEHPEEQSCGGDAVEEEVIAEPVAFALQTVKQSLGLLAVHGTPQIYLTGSGNYRQELAKLAPYKGNRDPSSRPVHYQAIRDYLVEHHGAVVVDGREADDEVSIQARQRHPHDYVIASIDKDLDQISGLHYDYMRHVKYDVSAEDAQRWFWIQCLSGDPGDNVPGCHRVGPVRAAKLIDYFLEEGATAETIWPAIVNVYFESQGRPDCPYAGLGADEVALETAQLVYIQRKPGELWMPPGTPFGRVAFDEY